MDKRSDDVSTVRRNFIFLALHQVVMRIGWIFKTETVVIPAFMDFVGGGPIMRGCLPVLNRIGFAVPPAIWAGRLKAAPLKKWKLIQTSSLSVFPFLLLALIWNLEISGTDQSNAPAWMPWLFLVLYAAFFSVTGLNHLAVNTLQGKLIPANMRGRLFASGTMVGAPLAILAAAIFMPRWMTAGNGGFDYVFAMAGGMFVLATLILLGIREPPDDHPDTATSFRDHLREAFSVWQNDRAFRRLVSVASLFSCVFMIFPHYQAVARESLGLARDQFMTWVCAQNLATMIASLTCGLLADRYGNRLAIQLAIGGSTVAPLLAISLAVTSYSQFHTLYWLVYFSSV